ncbi:MAG: hypothetical protein ACOZCO_08655 [Bacteroidota bacterium]
MKFLIYIVLFSITPMAVMKNPVDGWTAITVEEMAKETKKMEAFYKNTSSYSFKISHATYKNYTTTVTEERINGYYIKDSKNNYHSYIMGTHTIQNSKVKVTIDSTNRMIQINQPDRSFTKEVKMKEVEDMLAVCTSVKKQTGAYKYKLEFDNKHTYSAYEVWSNSSSQLEKIVMYFNAEFPSDPRDEKSPKTKPRAEVVFSDYKTGISPSYKEHFDESKYIKAKGETYVATDAYKNYKVYDLRVKTK